jgi:CubicO group peptidase (beta-lactamase class C family)
LGIGVTKGTRNLKFIGLLVFLVIILVVTLAATGCVEEPESGTESGTESVIESATYWPTEGWQTSTPEQQGLDSEKLAEALDYIREEDVNIHSLLIIRNGYVVTDAYFYPFAEGTVHDIASVTKSFTATLIGIAISEGNISDVEQPVLEFFPQRTVENVDANKDSMTLEDLLTMRSGFECVNEPSEVTLSRMQESPDWIQFTLDLPMAEEPGTRFVYCSSSSHLLSGIIRETTGMNESNYAQERLFEPLGISDTIWPSDPQGNNHGWGDLHLAPRDMAKLGYLYLNGGVWDGKQVVSAEWVAESTREQVSLGEVEGYGYQWWVPGSLSGLYEARGRGGQRIIIWPEKDIIVVTTGGGFEPGELAPFILEALQSDDALPENPEAYQQLQEKIEAAAKAPDQEPEPVQPLPEIAKEIEGKTYILDPNPVDIQSLSLTFDEERGEALLTLSFPEEQDREYLLGLDNVSRIFSGSFGLAAAAKGSWESDNVFVIHLDEVGNINQWRISLTFEADRVDVQMQEMTGLGSSEFGGRLESNNQQITIESNNQQRATAQE